LDQIDIDEGIGTRGLRYRQVHGQRGTHKGKMTKRDTIFRERKVEKQVQTKLYRQQTFMSDIQTWDKHNREDESQRRQVDKTQVVEIEGRGLETVRTTSRLHMIECPGGSRYGGVQEEGLRQAVPVVYSSAENNNMSVSERVVIGLTKETQERFNSEIERQCSSADDKYGRTGYGREATDQDRGSDKVIRKEERQDNNGQSCETGYKGFRHMDRESEVEPISDTGEELVSTSGHIPAHKSECSESTHRDKRKDNRTKGRLTVKEKVVVHNGGQKVNSRPRVRVDKRCESPRTTMNRIDGLTEKEREEHGGQQGERVRMSRGEIRRDHTQDEIERDGTSQGVKDIWNADRRQFKRGRSGCQKDGSQMDIRREGHEQRGRSASAPQREEGTVEYKGMREEGARPVHVTSTVKQWDVH
jgi:hypothetical protein